MPTIGAVVPAVPSIEATPPAARVRRVAVTLFAEHGYDATGIRQIARGAGMTSATLYHYTSSKEELLVDIMVEGQSAITTAALNGLQGVTEPECRLGVLVSGLVAAHATNPLSTRVVDTEVRSLRHNSDSRNRIVSLRDDYERLWTSALTDGVSEGVFDVTSVHIVRLALLTMCSGMSNWYRADAGVDMEGMCRHFVDITLGTVRAQRGSKTLRVDDLPSVKVKSVPHLLSEPRSV